MVHLRHATFHAQAALAVDALIRLQERNVSGILLREPAYLDAEKAVQPLDRMADTTADRVLAHRITADLETLEVDRSLFDSTEQLIDALRNASLETFTRSETTVKNSIALEKKQEEDAVKEAIELKKALASN